MTLKTVVLQVALLFMVRMAYAADPAPTAWLYVARQADTADGVGIPADGTQQPFTTLAGAKVHPLATIQKAVDRSTPCTAILVQGGTAAAPLTYDGSVKIQAVHSGTEAQPKWLVAETYRGALIRGDIDKRAILFNDASWWRLHNFRIESRVTDGTDQGAVYGFGEDDGSAGNLVIAGNHLSGQGKDCMKLAGGLRVLRVYGNYFTGDGFGESGIDLVNAVDVTAAYNTMRGPFSDNAIVPKGTAYNHRYVQNDIEMSGAASGLSIGSYGWSDAGKPAGFPQNSYQYASSWDVTAERNRIRATGSKAPVRLRGTLRAVVRDNWMHGDNGETVLMTNAKDGIPSNYDTAAVPGEHAPYVSTGTTGDGTPVFIFDNRFHVVTGNYAPVPVPAAMDPGQDNGHTIEAFMQAADASVLGVTVGEEAWDETAVYVHLGMQSGPVSVSVPPDPEHMQKGRFERFDLLGCRIFPGSVRQPGIYLLRNPDTGAVGRVLRLQ